MKQILWPPPMFLVTVSILEIITYFHPIDDALKYIPQKKNQFWRFFSYVFVHEDWLHLVPNLVAQLVLGWILEKKTHGWWKVGSLYLGSTVFGALTTCFTKRGIIGSSAAAYAMESAGLTYVLLEGKDGVWGEKHMRNFLFVYLLALTGMIAQNIYSLATGESVAWIAHLTGAVIGVLFAMLMFNNNDRVQYLKWIAGALLVISLIVLVQLNFIGF